MNFRLICNLTNEMKTTYYIQEEAFNNQWYTICEAEDKNLAIEECKKIEKRNHNRGGYRVIDEDRKWIY